MKMEEMKWRDDHVALRALLAVTDVFMPDRTVLMTAAHGMA